MPPTARTASPYISSCTPSLLHNEGFLIKLMNNTLRGEKTNPLNPPSLTAPCHLFGTFPLQQATDPSHKYRSPTSEDKHPLSTHPVQDQAIKK